MGLFGDHVGSLLDADRGQGSAPNHTSLRWGRTDKARPRERSSVQDTRGQGERESINEGKDVSFQRGGLLQKPTAQRFSSTRTYRNRMPRSANAAFKALSLFLPSSD